MKPIIWTDEYSVGIARLDEQHKQLVQMINRLVARPDVTTRSETVSELLNDLMTYAQEHFGTEEDLMRRYNFPHLEEHAAEHLAFWEKAVDLCSATALNVATVPDVILHHLHDWLETHILEGDMVYKPYFRQFGLK